jgi:glycosyltransferase involved in cell wall biosynthesis
MVMNDSAILLATFNGAKYISSFLDSLVQQSDRNFDLIVRDDGSTDETIAIIQSYADKIPVTFLPATGRLNSARNFVELLRKSKTGYKYYFFADQDDYWVSNKIERAVSNLQSHMNVPAMYFTKLELVDENLSHICYTQSPRIVSFENALVQNIASGCTIALNSAARNLYLSNLPHKLRMHDWWSYLLFTALGEVIYDDYPSVRYRQHSSNVVGASRSVWHSYGRRIKRLLAPNISGVVSYSGQAQEFYNCFGEVLDAEKSELVRKLINGRKTLLGRVGLMIRSPYVRQRTFDSFALRILFVLGYF